VKQIQQDVAGTLSGRKLRQAGDAFSLREPEPAYGDHFEVKKGTVSPDNRVYFDINAEESMG